MTYLVEDEEKSTRIIAYIPWEMGQKAWFPSRTGVAEFITEKEVTQIVYTKTKTRVLFGDPRYYCEYTLAGKLIKNIGKACRTRKDAEEWLENN